jgi:hypothetical protein
MYVRLLDVNDFKQVEKIYYDSFISDRKRKELRNIEVEKDFDKIEKVDKKWFDAIYNLYLNPKDTDHPMWGVFDDNDKLLVYTGVRLDLPGIWNDGFCFAWMKGDPAVNNVRNGAMYLMLKTAYDYCESIGKTKWYWIIEKDRHSRYNALAIKSTKFIDDRWDPYTLCEIPRGHKPDIEWVWSMIGRMPSTDTDYIVRAGSLKKHLLNSKT